MIVKMNVTKEEYIKMPGLSRSGIVKLIKGPNHYKRYIDKPTKTKSMDLGTALHDYILTPKIFEQNYVSAPEGMKFNTVAGQAFKKLHSEKVVLNFKTMQYLKDAKATLETKKTYNLIMDSAALEPCATWQEDGVDLKTMPDIVNTNLRVVADLKTIGRFSEAQMQFAIKDYGLDIQGAMALEAFPLDKFILIFVSTTYPIEVSFKRVYPEEILAAKLLYKEQLLVYKKCLQENNWPSKEPDDIIPIGLPIGEREFKDEDYYNEPDHY